MNKQRILVVGQTPPPYGGQAIMIQRLLEGTYSSVELVHVRLQFSKGLNTTGKVQLRKILHLIKVILEIYWNRVLKRPKVFLYHPGGPSRVSMIKDVFILITCRWLFDKTVLYFHAAGISELYCGLSRFMKPLFRLAFFRADYAIKVLESSYPDPEILRSRKIRHFPVGVPDYSNNIHLEAEDQSNIHCPKILFLSAIYESKGIFDLIEACARLAGENAEFSLELVGEFESEGLRENISRVIKDRGLSDRINIHGILLGQDKTSVFATSDIFCLPTFFHAENSPLVIIEAMCFGLPVVATNWRGIPSIVEDGRSGFLVPINDSQLLSEKLGLLLRDEALRKKMGKYGRDTYLKTFSLDQFYENHEMFFNEVTAD